MGADNRHKSRTRIFENHTPPAPPPPTPPRCGNRRKTHAAEYTKQPQQNSATINRNQNAAGFSPQLASGSQQVGHSYLTSFRSWA